ncbi:MAG: iron hydrogenase small subunit [Spirochaetales bacterium]|nr:iron hydrogenase small subunit [Spirochaetales bacterium]
MKDKSTKICLKINHKSVEVVQGATILEAAIKARVNIPTLCKHPDLVATGACGICVVRVAGRSQLLRACCTPAEDGMDVVTNDPEIIATRRTVLELILSTHPNECLTCGRNGTCELQQLAEDFGIREKTLPALVSDVPKDCSTGAIVLDSRKCIKCGRCLTVCQEEQNVWALTFKNRGLSTLMTPAGDISLDDSPCVKCGQCSAHCPVGAIYEQDDTGRVWRALSDPGKFCIAQIAPSVRTSLGSAFGYPVGTNLVGQIYDALRKIGFKKVFDTNFGADVTVMEEASELVKRLEENEERLPLITTCCPSWVDYMEKFYSDMIPYFSSCKSPHAILGTLTKTYYAQKMGIDPSNIVVVSIMPCTSKKYEIRRNEYMAASGYFDVDISITSREFIRMIKQAGIIFSELDFLAVADSPLGDYSGAGTIFGASGGVMEATLRTAHYFMTGTEMPRMGLKEIQGLEGIKETSISIGSHELKVAVAHGLKNVEFIIEGVKNAIRNKAPLPYHFIEVMACPGGCVGGGGQPWPITNEIRIKRAQGLFKDDSMKKNRSSHENESIKELYKDFLGEPLGPRAMELLHNSYQVRDKYKR